jgi:micrococcal nuclease
MMHLMNRCLYRNLSLLWCSGLRGWKKSGAGLSLGFWRSLQLAGLMWVIWGGLMVSGCQSPSVGSVPLKGYRMSVQAVINGNTLEAIGVETIGEGTMPDWKDKRLRVRLIGVDAPDPAQDPWGEAAREFLAEQVGFGSESGQDDRLVLVSLDTQVQDGYDRVLAYVWTDAGLVNEAIVAAGHGLARSYFPNVKYEAVLADAQAEARLLGRGIWNPDQPLRESPSAFRKRQK